ncbi:MAG: hypothetical protein GF368_04980 [Candidatus Aenigmarchaeota archaeon]|nr:hypothetical protein [Candidatus Aenigmarchaeota archaeon]
MSGAIQVGKEAVYFCINPSGDFGGEIPEEKVFGNLGKHWPAYYVFIQTRVGPPIESLWVFPDPQGPEAGCHWDDIRGTSYLEGNPYERVILRPYWVPEWILPEIVD